VPTSKHFFSGVVLFAYLLIGSGPYAARATKPDARLAVKEFADSLPRKIYRYSVVSGGVNTPEELAAARRNDPVVAAHFADFGKNTRITTLQEDMYVYVSYRQGNKVYYTKKKHKVCKGEVVITDGKNFARARCANRLTRVFRPPALAFDEPSAPQFDYVDPPAAPDVAPSEPTLASNFYGLPDASSYAPPSPNVQTGANPGPPSAGYLENGPEPILPSLVPYSAGASAFFVPPSGGNTVVIPPPVVTPEPAEWVFVLASVLLLLALVNRKQRFQKKA
jgi:hypothetical protein